MVPNARKSQVTGVTGGTWTIKVSAPPVEGKANAVLLKFLSQVVGAGVGSFMVKKGLNSRNKVIEVAGVPDDELALRLSRALPVKGGAD